MNLCIRKETARQENLHDILKTIIEIKYIYEQRELLIS